MIDLPAAHRRAIERHGEQGYPDEVCGFLIGRAQGNAKMVEAVTPIENAWAEAGHASEFAAAGGADFAGETRRRRFTIPPDEYYQADKAARAAGQSVLGFYHSHPDHLARPSQYDLRLAQEIFPGYSYIIVAVHNGEAVELTDWVLRDDGSRFEAEEIVPPSPPTLGGEDSAGRDSPAGQAKEPRVTHSSPPRIGGLGGRLGGHSEGPEKET